MPTAVTHRTRRVTFWLTLVLTGVALPCAAQLPQVVSFDSAWSIIQRTHFDTTFNGLNWSQIRTELRPRAEAAQTREALRPVLMDMLNRLKQSHFSIIPQDLADSPQDAGGSGDVGMEVRWVENALVVTSVDADGPAAAAGVRPGWLVQSIGGVSADSILTRARRSPSGSLASLVPRLAAGRLSGAPGSTVALEFVDGANQRRQVTATRRIEPGDPIKFGNLPTFYTRFNADQITYNGVQVGVLAFNVWMIPVVARIDTAMDRLRDSHGVIIDLRGNPGGAAAMAMGVAGHFADTARSLGSMTGRSGRLQFNITPRRVSTAGQRVVPFSGPVALLIDELSGSTSEVFAGGLQSMGRVRIFGVRSMGAVLPAAMDRLPNGDVLYHAVADFVTPDGTVLEGRGVEPHETIELKRADFLAGRDPIMDAALRWIAGQRRTNTTEIMP